MGFTIGTKVRIKEVKPVFDCGIKLIDEDMEQKWNETPTYQKARENIGKVGKITQPIKKNDKMAFVRFDEENACWTPLECLEEVKVRYSIQRTIMKTKGDWVYKADKFIDLNWIDKDKVYAYIDVLIREYLKTTIKAYKIRNINTREYDKSKELTFIDDTNDSYVRVIFTIEEGISE